MNLLDPLNPAFQFAFTLYGFQWFLFGYGVYQTFKVFHRKSSIPFILIISGFISTLLSTHMTFAVHFWDPSNEMAYVVVDSFAFPIMILSTLFSYYYRLKTLKYNSNDKYILILPFIVFLAIIPDAVLYNLNARIPNDYLRYLGVTGAIVIISVSITEIIMFYLLVKRLMMIVETNTAWMIKVFLTLGMIIIMDILEICFFFTRPDISNIFFSFPFMVRLNAVVLFYGDLVQFVKQGECFKKSYNKLQMSGAVNASRESMINASKGSLQINE
eukprot:NODE_691_length_4696_cov_0.623885.p3 type:complete len:272 gc:universal NODE_691_length_4696_cov_0.623885:4668-3853(-)